MHSTSLPTTLCAFVLVATLCPALDAQSRAGDLIFATAPTTNFTDISAAIGTGPIPGTWQVSPLVQVNQRILRLAQDAVTGNFAALSAQTVFFLQSFATPPPAAPCPGCGVGTLALGGTANFVGRDLCFDRSVPGAPSLIVAVNNSNVAMLGRRNGAVFNYTVVPGIGQITSIIANPANGEVFVGDTGGFVTRLDSTFAVLAQFRTSLAGSITDLALVPSSAAGVDLVVATRGQVWGVHSIELWQVPVTGGLPALQGFVDIVPVAPAPPSAPVALMADDLGDLFVLYEDRSTRHFGRGVMMSSSTLRVGTALPIAVPLNPVPLNPVHGIWMTRSSRATAATPRTTLIPAPDVSSDAFVGSPSAVWSRPGTYTGLPFAAVGTRVANVPVAIGPAADLLVDPNSPGFFTIFGVTSFTMPIPNTPSIANTVVVCQWGDFGTNPPSTIGVTPILGWRIGLRPFD